MTGNAGALTISLNGKTLEPLGPVGQVRVVKLTAEGPQFLRKLPRPRPIRSSGAAAIAQRFAPLSSSNASSLPFRDQQFLAASLLGADIDLAPELVEVRDRGPDGK